MANSVQISPVQYSVNAREGGNQEYLRRKNSVLQEIREDWWEDRREEYRKDEEGGRNNTGVNIYLSMCQRRKCDRIFYYDYITFVVCAPCMSCVCEGECVWSGERKRERKRERERG